MISASNEFRLAVEYGRSDYDVTVNLSLIDQTDVTLTNANIMMDGLTIEDAISPSGSLQFGSSIINSAKVVINNFEGTFTDVNFIDAEAEIYIGYDINGTVERIRKFTGTVVQSNYGGSSIALTIYDHMHRFDKPYNSSLDFANGQSLINIVTECCAQCGVTTSLSTFPNSTYLVYSLPSSNSTTYRDVIGWAAQIAGRCARCNRFGALEFVWYDMSTLATNLAAFKDAGKTAELFANPNYFISTNTPNFYADSADQHLIHAMYSHTVALDETIVSGLKLRVNTGESYSDSVEEYTYGSDDYMLVVEGNPLIRENADALVVDMFTALNPQPFHVASITQVRNPLIEAGDIAIVFEGSKLYPVIVSSVNFLVGGSQTIESSAQTKQRQAATRYSEGERVVLQAREMIRQERTARETAYDNLEEAINSHSGLYQTVEHTTYGDIYYLHDQPTIATSTIIWRMSAEAFGVSTDGGTTWNLGFTVTGDMLVRILSAGLINADWIQAGDLTLGYGEGRIGTLKLYDAQNNLVCEMSQNGLKTSGEDGSYVMLNNTVGFAGFDRNDNKIYWADKDEFHMKKAVVESEITLCSKLRFISVTLEDNGTVVNDGIALVSVVGE